MFKIKLLIATLVMVATSSFAQTFTQQEMNSINNEIYQKLVKQNSLVMKKQTIEGKVSSCDFEYEYAYRDFAAKQGATVSVLGAFGFIYAKGKVPSYMLKIQPYVSDVLATKDKWRSEIPAYAEVFANGQGIGKYQVGEFQCENGGLCRVYSDSDGMLSKLFFEKNNLDIEIKFSLSKGGMDNSIVFSTLAPKEKYIKQSIDFAKCSLEIIGRVKKDLQLISQ